MRVGLNALSVLAALLEYEAPGRRRILTPILPQILLRSAAPWLPLQRGCRLEGGRSRWGSSAAAARHESCHVYFARTRTGRAQREARRVISIRKQIRERGLAGVLARDMPGSCARSGRGVGTKQAPAASCSLFQLGIRSVALSLPLASSLAPTSSNFALCARPSSSSPVGHLPPLPCAPHATSHRARPSHAPCHRFVSPPPPHPGPSTPSCQLHPLPSFSRARPPLNPPSSDSCSARNGHALASGSFSRGFAP